MLALRAFCAQDIAPLIRILNEPQVVEHLSSKIPFPYTQAHAQWWIECGSRENGYTHAITYHNQLIGCIGVSPGEHEYARSGEIGYWLDKQYWRQGITSWAVQKVIPWVFHNTELERIFATVFAGNSASEKLLLKCGFEHEAVLKKAIYKNGQYFDSHLFACLK